MQPQSMSLMERLNYDVVDNIFARLKCMDLINCATVSPLFREVANDQFRRRFKFFVLDNDTLLNSFAKLKLVFEHIGPYVLHLTIDSERAPNMHLQYLYHIINMCPRLETLHFTNQYFNSPESEGVPDLRNVQSMNFCNSSFGDKRIGPLLERASTKMTAMSFNLVAMTGRCLIKAPPSVRTVSFEDTHFLHLNNVKVYLKHNPHLIDFKIVKELEEDVDLASLCANLREVQILKLHCMRFANFEALAKLNDLYSLDIIIRSSRFYQYPSSLAGNQNLKELRLEMTNMDVSHELARSFQHFRHLTTLKLFIDRTVTNYHRLMPYLGTLPQLSHVALTGEPCDLDAVCSHLTQIKMLRIDVSVDNLANLARLKNLSSLEVSVDDKFRTRSDDVSAAVNRLLFAVARSNTLKSLSLQVKSVKVRLDADTVTALRTFCLEHVQLYGGIFDEEALKLAANLPCLTSFTQYHTSVDTFKVRAALNAIRPGALKITLKSCYWMQM